MNEMTEFVPLGIIIVGSAQENGAEMLISKMVK